MSYERFHSVRCTTAALVALALAVVGCTQVTTLAGSTGGADGSGGGGGQSAGGGDTSCMSVEQCTDDHGGIPHLCKSEGCVPVISERCDRVIGTPISDDSVIVGAIKPESWSGAECALKLPVAEWNDAGGIVGASGVRPLSVVLCDDADAEGAARHLVERVGVSAIIGPFSSGGITIAVEDVAAPANVLTLATNFSPELAQLDADGLYLSMGQLVPLPDTYLALITALEGHLKNTGSEPPSKIRVAVVGAETTLGFDFAQRLLSELTFNGQSGEDNLMDKLADCHPQKGCFQLLASEEPMTSSDWSHIVAELSEFQPNVVLLLTRTGTFYQVAMPAVEEALAAASRQPIWVAPWAAPELLGYVGSEEAPSDLHNRVLALELAGRSTSAFEGFEARYAATCGALSPRMPYVPPVGGALYDAVYGLAYAHVAKGSRNVTAPSGQDLASALLSFGPGGMAVAFDPTSIAMGTAALLGGGEIEAEGVIGPLAFDPATGFRKRVEVPVHCLFLENSVNNSYGDRPTGWVWDPASESLQGSYDFSCAP